MSSPGLAQQPAVNWRQVADAAPTLAEPITIAEWWKNRRGESVRLTLSQFQGRSIVDLRTWFTQLKPGNFAAEVRHLPRLAAAIAKAERKARELGLIGDEEGAARGISTNSLACRIVETVFDEKMIDAELDEADGVAAYRLGAA